MAYIYQYMCFLFKQKLEEKTIHVTRVCGAKCIHTSLIMPFVGRKKRDRCLAGFCHFDPKLYVYIFVSLYYACFFITGSTVNYNIIILLDVVQSAIYSFACEHKWKFTLPVSWRNVSDWKLHNIFIRGPVAPALVNQPNVFHIGVLLWTMAKFHAYTEIVSSVHTFYPQKKKCSYLLPTFSIFWLLFRT